MRIAGLLTTREIILSDFAERGSVLVKSMGSDDHELLRRYAREGSEEAFAELTRRRLDLAWAAAMRITGNADMAREVAQRVFCDLARKARFIPASVVLGGWIYRAACLEARRTVRDAARRARREKDAMELHATHSPESDTERDAAELLPHLDTALCSLSSKDRDAVVLRFLEKKSLAAVGHALGVSEDAAQKRVSRALEKLRAKLAVGSGTIASVLTVAGTQAAPAGTAASLVVGTSAISGPTALVFYIKTQIACMKTQLILGTIATTVIATPLVVQQQTLESLRAENILLSEQADRVAALQAENASLARRGFLAQELAQLERNHTELLALRQELAALQNTEHARKAQLLEQIKTLSNKTERTTEEAERLANNGRRIQERMNDIRMIALTLIRRFRFESVYGLPSVPNSVQDALMTSRLSDVDSIDASNYEFHPRFEATSFSKHPQNAILVREIEPVQVMDGKWTRAYGFADGHSELWSSDSPDYTQRENDYFERIEKELANQE